MKTTSRIFLVLLLLTPTLSWGQNPGFVPFGFFGKKSLLAQGIDGPICFDGRVMASTTDGANVYVGGSFQNAGQCIGGGVPVDTTAGSPAQLYAALEKVNGAVNAVVPDGSGGWYIGGDFTFVGSAGRNSLARINSDGTINGWGSTTQLNAGAVVNSLKVDTANDRLLVGGNFSGINLAVNTSGASLDNSWSVASTNSIVSGGGVAVAIPDGSGGWYIGGDFTSVGGYDRGGVARVNSDGSINTSFAPGKVWRDTASVKGSVTALLLDGNNLYIGGLFTSIGGVSRLNVAAVDVTTNTVTGFKPNICCADSTVRVQALAKRGSNIVIGGNFTDVGVPGLGYGSAGVYSMTDGSYVFSNLPKFNGNVTKVISDGANGWFVAGTFTMVGTETRNKVARILSDGTLSTFNPNITGTVSALYLDGNTLYVGGDFTMAQGVARSHIAAYNITTGAIESFNPTITHTSGGVNAILTDSTKVYFGGLFTAVNSTPRDNVAAVLKSDSSLDAWDPKAQNKVNAMALDGAGNIILAGAFMSVSYTHKSGVLGFNRTTNAVVSFPIVKGTVKVMIPDGSGGFFIGGSFTEVGGVARTNLAQVDSGMSVTSWNPNPNAGSTINRMVLAGSTVYVSGNFSTIGGQSRTYLAGVSATTGLATAWNPNPNSTVSALFYDGTNIYVGGSFTNIASTARNRIAAFDASTLNLTSLNPDANSTVTNLYVYNDYLFIAGDFSTINSIARAYFATVVISTNTLHSFNPAMNWPAFNGGDGITVSGGVLYLAGWFSTISGVSANNMAAYDISTFSKLTWNPTTSQYGTMSIKVDGSYLYATNAWGYIRRFNISDGSDDVLYAPPPIDPSSVYTVNPYIAYMDATNIFISGTDVTTGGGGARVAKVNMTTGARDTGANAIPNQEVNSVLVDGSDVYIGGSFDNLNNNAASRHALARLNLSDFSVSSWNATLWSSYRPMKAIVKYGSTILVGGGDASSGLEQVNGQIVDGIAGLNISNAAWSSFKISFSDRRINDMAISGTNLFVGTDTTSVWKGAQKCSLGEFNASTGVVTAWSPMSTTSCGSYNISSMVTDASTLYVGGMYTQLFGQTRLGLASIDLAAGTLNAWNPAPVSYTNKLAINSTKLYVGGNFTTIASTSRTRLAAFNLSNMALDTTFTPTANNNVTYMAADDNGVYISGGFTTVNSVTKTGWAALDPSTGAHLAWSPTLPTYPRVLYPNGSGKIYVGYNTTTTFGGTVRTNFAAYKISDGSILPLTANTNATINVVETDGTNVFIGGSFSQVNGVSRNYLAAVDGSSVVAAWNPAPNNYPKKLLSTASGLYVAGQFTTIASTSKPYLAKFDTSLNLVTGFTPTPNSIVNAIYLGADGLYAGGHFSSMGGTARAYLARVDADTGALHSWPANNNASGIVNDIESDGTNIYVGGTFSQFRGVARLSAAALDIAGGTITAWNPKVMGTINDLSMSGTAMYIAGSIGALNPSPRGRLAAYDATTGNLTGWNPTADGDIYAIHYNSGKVFIGGNMTKINNVTRNYGGAVNATNGSLLSFNPAANSYIRVINSDTDTVYFGGSFSNFLSQSRSYLAAVNVSDLTLKSFNPAPGYYVYAIEPDGSNVFIGGQFGSIGGASRSLVAQIDKSTGLATSWQLSPANTVGGRVIDIKVYGSSVYVSSLNAPYISKHSLSTGAIDSNWTGSASGAVVSLGVDASGVYAAGEFLQANSTSRIGLARFNHTDGGLTSWTPIKSGSGKTGGWPDNAQCITTGVNANDVYYGGWQTMGLNGGMRSGGAFIDTITGATSK